MKTQHHSILSARVGQTAGKTPNETSRRKLFLLGLCGLAFLSVCTLSPTPVEAQCKQWDVSGTWQVRQSNGGEVEMKLRMEGTRVVGTARSVQDSPIIPVTGTMIGNKLNFTIYWGRRVGFPVETDPVGVYRGTIDAGGGMRGTTYDKSDPGRASATWYSNRSFVCAEVGEKRPPNPTMPPAATPTPGRVIGKTGKSPSNPGGFVGAAGWLGRWDTKTDRGGHFELIFQQVGPTLGGNSTLIGTFRDLNGNPQYDGQLRGTLSGNVLTYECTQSGVGSTGQFALAPSGTTITGSGVSRSAAGTTEFKWWGSKTR